MSSATPEFTSPSGSPIDWSQATPPSTFTPPERPRSSALGAVKKAVAGSKKSTPAPKTRAPKKTEPPSKQGEFTEDITAFYTMAGMAVAMRDPQCGKAIVESAAKIGEEWDKLAESNAAVRKALRTLAKTTAVGTLIAAHMPIVMAVSAHHGVGFGPKVAKGNEDEQDRAA